MLNNNPWHRFCTHTHQTILRHPARSLILVAFRSYAAHIDEAKRLGTVTAILAIRLEHGLKPDEGILLAYATYLIEFKPARLSWCDRDGPGHGKLAWRERRMEIEKSIKEKGQ